MTIAWQATTCAEAVHRPRLAQIVGRLALAIASGELDPPSEVALSALVSDCERAGLSLEAMRVRSWTAVPASELRREV